MGWLMSECRIDHDHKIRYDPALDVRISIDKAQQIYRDRREYEIREWHRYHDAPPPGYGIDGYPLMRGKRMKTDEI